MLLHSKILGNSANHILILHGFLGSGDNWMSVAKKLSQQDFCIHLIDQRNHGRSFHSDEFNYELMCGDLHNYICLLYTSPSPRDLSTSRMPSSA